MHKKGDSLSPTMFGIFINANVEDVKSVNTDIEIDGHNICILLYADDIVLLSDTKEGLQQQGLTMVEPLNGSDKADRYRMQRYMSNRNYIINNTRDQRETTEGNYGEHSERDNGYYHRWHHMYDEGRYRDFEYRKGQEYNREYDESSSESDRYSQQ